MPKIARGTHSQGYGSIASASLGKTQGDAAVVLQVSKSAGGKTEVDPKTN